MFFKEAELTEQVSQYGFYRSYKCLTRATDIAPKYNRLRYEALNKERRWQANIWR